MEWILLILIIMMTAVAIAYSGELYLYLSLVFGSIIRDIQNFINKMRGK
jgi:hypothetical protein